MFNFYTARKYWFSGGAVVQHYPEMDQKPRNLYIDFQYREIKNKKHFVFEHFLHIVLACATQSSKSKRHMNFERRKK